MPLLRTCFGERDGEAWLREMTEEIIDFEVGLPKRYVLISICIYTFYLDVLCTKYICKRRQQLSETKLLCMHRIFI